MLYEFKRQKKSSVYCTYLLGGLKDEEGVLAEHFILTGEEHLEKRKEEFQELLCQHIYSVGPAKLSSLEMVFAAEEEKFSGLLQDTENVQTVDYLLNKVKRLDD
jgi:hypothetical protein